jgi:hypothetical protein
MTNKIQTHTIHLITQFMGLQRYFDEPSSSEAGQIMALKGESERFGEAALRFLSRTRQQFIRNSLQDQRLLG